MTGLRSQALPLAATILATCLTALPLTADIVVVENTSGSITVRVVNRLDVDIQGRSASGPIQSEDIEVERKPAAGLIVRPAPAHDSAIDLELEVPYQTSLGLTTTSGKIAVEGMPAALDVQTESGDLELALPWYSSYLDFLAERQPRELQIPDHVNRRRKKQGLQLRQHTRVGRDYRGYSDVRVRTQSSPVVKLREIPIPEDSPIKPHWLGRDALENLFRVDGPVRLLERDSPDAQQKADSQADIRADAGLVDLLVHVTDNQGRVLSDLESNDFRVTENGLPQEIRSVRKVDIPVNVVVFLDWNKHLYGRLTLSLQAVDRFIDTLRPADRMAIHALVSNLVYMTPRLTGDRAKLRDGLMALNRLHVAHVKKRQTRLGGPHSLWDPMLVSMTDELPEHDDELNVFVPITGGVDLFSEVPFSSLVDAVEEMARELNIRTYPIAVQNPALFRGDPSRLQHPIEPHLEQGRLDLGLLSEAGGGRLFHAETPEKIGVVLEQILDEVGSAYSLSYSPNNEHFGGEWRSIRVETNRPEVNLHYRPGYVARP